MNRLADLLKGLVSMKSWSYSDRRRLLRVPCELEIQVQKGEALMVGEVRDLSLGGLQLLCYGRVRRGEKIAVKSKNPHRSAKYDLVRCTVRWAQKVGSAYLLGAAFTEDESYMTRSWVFHDLKALGRRSAQVYQKRENLRVSCSLPVTLVVGQEQRPGRLRDLGLNGARVECEGRVLEHGSLVWLNFGPHQRLPKLSVLAEIILVRGHRVPHYGLSFQRFEQGDQQAVGRYLDFFFKNPES